MHSTDELITAFFRNWENENKGEDFWAFEKISDLKNTDPAGLWDITLLLIEKAPSSDALNYVAAGPLEDLLREHGSYFFDHVIQEAKSNKRFLYTLAGVWLDSEDDAFFNALEQLKKTYKLDEFNPLNNAPWDDNNPKPG